MSTPCSPQEYGLPTLQDLGHDPSGLPEEQFPGGEREALRRLEEHMELTVLGGRGLWDARPLTSDGPPALPGLGVRLREAPHVSDGAEPQHHGAQPLPEPRLPVRTHLLVEAV